MTSKKPRTKQQVIRDLWDETQSESLGVLELRLIQEELKTKFGWVESPTSIARTLADHGVRLRHPEVLNEDCAWRQQRLQMLRTDELEFNTVENAVRSMAIIERLRAQFSAREDQSALQILVEHVRELKANLGQVRGDLVLELVQWLTVWLQNPEIFEDWLSLRRASPDFLRRFGALSS
jgi:hypothetical protein